MHEIDWQLLIRYVAGECTATEREQLERWLAEDPEHREVLAGVRRASALAGQTVSPERSGAVLARIRAEYASDGAGRRLAPTLTMPVPRSRVWWSTALKVAAVVMLVVGMGVVGRRVGHGVLWPTEQATSYSVVSTARGQRLSIRLPDSTLVTLAPSSTLRTPSTYGTRNRTVALEGEAVFTVVHDETRPFTVRTPHALARDIGTRFVVRAYPGEIATEVVVAEGSVSVEPRDLVASHPSLRPLVVTPGERVRVGADGQLTFIRDVALDRYFDWTEGRLVFRDTPLDEVAAQLGRWYDIEVRLASPSIRSFPITATFEQQPAPEVLRRIAMSLGLDLSQADRTFTLSPRSP